MSINMARRRWAGEKFLYVCYECEYHEKDPEGDFNGSHWYTLPVSCPQCGESSMEWVPEQEETSGDRKEGQEGPSVRWTQE